MRRTQEERRQATQAAVLTAALDVLIANGYANRFLFVCVRRSKKLPHGGNLAPSDIERTRP